MIQIYMLQPQVMMARLLPQNRQQREYNSLYQKTLLEPKIKTVHQVNVSKLLLQEIYKTWTFVRKYQSRMEDNGVYIETREKFQPRNNIILRKMRHCSTIPTNTDMQYIKVYKRKVCQDYQRILYIHLLLEQILDGTMIFKYNSIKQLNMRDQTLITMSMKRRLTNYCKYPTTTCFRVSRIIKFYVGI